MKIFVIRHGKPDLNKAKILQGQTEDGKLNAQLLKGHELAEVANASVHEFEI